MNVGPDPYLHSEIFLHPQAWHCLVFPRTPSPKAQDFAIQRGCCPKISTLQHVHSSVHPILPIDPLFHEEITRQELVSEIKKLNSDKSPGEDGIIEKGWKSFSKSGGSHGADSEILSVAFFLSFFCVEYPSITGLWGQTLTLSLCLS